MWVCICCNSTQFHTQPLNTHYKIMDRLRYIHVDLPSDTTGSSLIWKTSHKTVVFPLCCAHRYIFKLPWCVNYFLHTTKQNRLSPIWLQSCTFRVHEMWQTPSIHDMQKAAHHHQYLDSSSNCWVKYFTFLHTPHINGCSPHCECIHIFKQHGNVKDFIQTKTSQANSWCPQ